MEEKKVYMLSSDDLRHIASMLERADDIPDSMQSARSQYIETLRVISYGMSYDERIVYVSTVPAVIGGWCLGEKERVHCETDGRALALSGASWSK